MKLVSALALVCTAIMTTGCGPVDDVPERPAVDAPEPERQSTVASVEEASVEDTAGVSLASVDDIAAFLETNRDKVLVINFWATWCAPCIHEMPELAAFYEAYKDRGVAFLSLSADALEDYDTKLVPFVNEHNLPFHVYAIANADPDELDKHLNVGMNFALPTTFVFDRNRTLVEKWMRNITQADLEQAVEPLLEESPGRDESTEGAQ